MYYYVGVCVCTCSEVRQSLTSAQQQYSQWAMLLDSDVDPEKVQSIGSELKNLIKSIEWDLEDLDQTISIHSYPVYTTILCVCVCYDVISLVSTI